MEIFDIFKFVVDIININKKFKLNIIVILKNGLHYCINC